jgi:hypothetical protein
MPSMNLKGALTTPLAPHFDVETFDLHDSSYTRSIDLFISIFLSPTTPLEFHPLFTIFWLGDYPNFFFRNGEKNSKKN